LLHAAFEIQKLFDEADELKHVYQPEDPETSVPVVATRQLSRGRGEPAVHHTQDAALNAAYRERYVTSHEVFARGAVSGADHFAGRVSGFTGQITQQFHEREFGKKLVEGYRGGHRSHACDRHAVCASSRSRHRNCNSLGASSRSVCGRSGLLAHLEKNLSPRSLSAARSARRCCSGDNPGSKSGVCHRVRTCHASSSQAIRGSIGAVAQAGVEGTTGTAVVVSVG